MRLRLQRSVGLMVATTVAVALAPSGAAAAEDDAPTVAPSGEAAGEPPKVATCFGRSPTIIAIPGVETTGTPEADVILGSDEDDVIQSLGGDDRICAGDGADTVDGGDGRDRIDGGSGDDELAGGNGDDRLRGGDGADTLDGGEGVDVCWGGPGFDWLLGCNDANATQGTLMIRKDTRLTGPHVGEIVIGANRITLDCGGHTVTGSGAGHGIHVRDRRRVAIRHCDVTNFTNGIYLERSRRITVARNRAHGNAMRGVALYQSNRNRIAQNVAMDNGFGRDNTTGFDLTESHGNLVERNIASGNGNSGFSLWNGSSRNTLSDNSAAGSPVGFGLADASALQNTFVDNTCVTKGLEVGSTPYGLCDTSPEVGPAVDGASAQ